MTLGIVNINSCVTYKLPIIKKILPCDNRISCRQILLYIVDKHPCNLFTSVVFGINYLMLLVIIIQFIVKIGLVTEIFIPN